MLLLNNFNVNAVETLDCSKDIEIADEISEMISICYSDHQGNYKLETPVTIYNTDININFYLIPIYNETICDGMIELNSNGNFTLYEDTSLYFDSLDFISNNYIIYTTGGVVFAENESTYQLKV